MDRKKKERLSPCIEKKKKKDYHHVWWALSEIKRSAIVPTKKGRR